MSPSESPEMQKGGMILMGEHDELMEIGKLKEHEAEIVKAALEVAVKSTEEVLGPTSINKDTLVNLAIAIFEHWNTGR